MLRHVPQPLHAGGLVGRVRLGVRVDHGPSRRWWMKGLLLLLQQLDQLLLGADVAPDAPVGVVEIADDGGLFGERGRHPAVILKLLRPQTRCDRDPESSPFA